MSASSSRQFANVAEPQATLQPTRTQGWRSGFSNMFRKEMGLWWSTRRWLTQSVVWVLMLNGLVALVVSMAKKAPSGALGPQPPGSIPILVLMALQVFVQAGIIATAVGAVVQAQSAIIGERQSGTAAWVLSKPVSRESYILAKVLAHVINLSVLALLLPSMVLLPEVRLLTGHWPTLLPLLGAVGILFVHMLFYQFLTFLAGTWFASRGPVLAIGLVCLFSGGMLQGLRFYPYMPWSLGAVATVVVGGEALSRVNVMALVIVGAAAVVFLAVALWRFHREEL